MEVSRQWIQAAQTVPDGKDAGALKKYFESVYPDIDFERVYTSDLKKMAKWLQVLKNNGVELKLSELAEENGEATEDITEPVDEQAIEKPAKKKSAKATTPGEGDSADDTATKPAKDKQEPVTADEAPKKKAAPKAKKRQVIQMLSLKSLLKRKPRRRRNHKLFYYCLHGATRKYKKDPSGNFFQKTLP